MRRKFILKTSDIRLQQLTQWLQTVLGKQAISSLEPASADASFRRYFRVFAAEQSLIAMDAPPEKEDSQPFVHIAKALSKLGVHAPQILAENLEQGFLLLEDLGNTDYLDELKQPNRAAPLYQDALRALVKIQAGSIPTLPSYSDTKLRAEMSLFTDWFYERHLQQSLSSEQSHVWQLTQDLLCDVCAQQPQVLVHRDYHSRNLMVTAKDNPGVIDFQDMVIGPISYDLASIFKDCYIEWPRKQQLLWLADYYELIESPEFSLEQLTYWYDLTGLQRHLKVLGIFCRLNYRDGKPRYLADLPLVAKYCLEVLELYSTDESILNDFHLAFAQAIKQVL